MTSPTRSPRRNPTSAIALLSGAAAALGVGLALGACSEPPPPPAPPPPPPPPPAPVEVRVSDILQALGTDAKVQFPQERAPFDQSLAEAVASFANAFATGDSFALNPMLDQLGKEALDELLGDGSWFIETDRLEAVRVVSLEQIPDEDDDAEEASLTLAFQRDAEAYIVSWSASDALGSWVFSPVFDEADPMPSATDFDD